ncbi:MAG: LuxR C-terminal-related transcriptional regulator [Prosthecobacter sp.]
MVVFVCREETVSLSRQAYEALDVSVKSLQPYAYCVSGPACTAMPKLAAVLKTHLTSAGRRVKLVAERDLRLGLCDDLGFSEVDRMEVLRRGAHLTRSHLGVGDIVIGVFDPLDHHHLSLLREILGESLRLIQVDCATQDCSQRQQRPAPAQDQGAASPPHADALIRVHEQPLEQSLPLLLKLFEEASSRKPPAPRRPRSGGGSLPVSAREMEILTLVSRGLRDKEIAFRLGISATTVRTHLKRVYDKLAVSSRAEAVALFVQQSRPESLPACPVK